MNRRLLAGLLVLLISFNVNGQGTVHPLQNFADPGLFNLKDTVCPNLSGEWVGEETEYYDQPGKPEGRYHVKFILKQGGNRVSGNSLISFSDGTSYGNMKIRGLVAGNKLHFEEYEVVEQKFSQPNVIWCLRTGEMEIKFQGDKAVLESANYKGYAAFYYFECGGRVSMRLEKAMPAVAANGVASPVAMKEQCEMQLRPNPANHEVTVVFKIAEDSPVKINFFTLSGELISNIADAFYKAGTHQQLFNLGTYAAGVYLIRLQARNLNDSKLLVISR